MKKHFFDFLQFLGIGYVYVLSDLSISLRPIGKVGFTDSAELQRLDCIQKSICDKKNKDVQIRIVWFFPSFAPRPVEQLTHWIFRHFKTDKFCGSDGGTEWFAVGNYISGLLILMLSLYSGAELYVILICVVGIVFLPLPLDLAISITIISLLQIASVTAFFWLVLYLISIFF